MKKQISAEKLEQIRKSKAKKAESKLRKKAEKIRRAEQKKQAAERRKKNKTERTIRHNERVKKRSAAFSAFTKKLGNSKNGFDYKSGGILPSVEIEFSGDFTSLACALISNGVKILGSKKAGAKTIICVSKKESKKAIAILNEMCYNYTISANYGLWRVPLYLLARIGIPIAIALSVIALYISYGYIWKVEITGNGNLSKAAIGAVLSDSGIARGVKKYDGLCTAAERALMNSEGISDASCFISGTTMHVNILETFDTAQKKDCTKCVSDYDAIVTKIVANSGTPTVKRGDPVKKGDLLASGDVFGTGGQLLYTDRCDVTVYGKVSLSYAVNLPQTTVSYQPTGRSKVKTVFTLFGKNLGKAVSPFSAYEMSAHTSGLDLLIPLYVTSYTFLETAPVETPTDIEAAVNEFAAQKKSELCLSEDAKFSYTVTGAVAGMKSVHVFITGEMPISHGE